MLVSLEARVAARCKSCSVLTPMPGLRNELSCRGCAAAIDFRERAADSREGGLRYPFGGFYDALAEAVILIAEGEECKDARDSQGTPVALRRAVPRCLACDALLPMVAEGATEVACPTCRDVIAVRWPDNETRAWDPRLCCVFGDAKGRDRDVRQQSRDGALIQCSHCGAPLADVGKDDRRRSRSCTHCGGVTYLGDAAWLALYPQPEWHRSYLVYSLDERAVLALHEWMARNHERKYWLDEAKQQARRAAHDEARRAARGAVVAALARGDATTLEIEMLAVDPSSSEAEAAAIDALLDDERRSRIGAAASWSLMRMWTRSPSPVVRNVVASHRACDAATLDGLANDSDDKVRISVAAHASTSAATLARLRKDPNEEVVAAVKRNPSYQPGLFEKLFG